MSSTPYQEVRYSVGALSRQKMLERLSDPSRELLHTGTHFKTHQLLLQDPLVKQQQQSEDPPKESLIDGQRAGSKTAMSQSRLKMQLPSGKRKRGKTGDKNRSVQQLHQGVNENSEYISQLPLEYRGMC